MIRKLLFLLCFSYSAAADIPKWFFSPPENDQKNLYGIAAGREQNVAVKYALGNVSERLSISIFF